MPTYEYRCADCGHEFEAQQAFSDDALTECPSCKGSLKKKFGSVGISFKGSGFYKNDSRGSSSSSSTSSSASSTSDSSGSDASSTAPATTTTSAPSAASTASPAASPASTS